MASMRDILGIKGNRVAAIEPGATVYQAAVRMNEDRIGSLVVLDQGRLVGIITERDILQRVVAQRRDAGQTAVAEVMTADLVCCRLYTTIEEARSVMKNRRIRHMPVVDDEGCLEGLISIGDLNAFEANTQEQTIHFLQAYISGQA